jgi:hypothetical protein
MAPPFSLCPSSNPNSSYVVQPNPALVKQKRSRDRISFPIHILSLSLPVPLKLLPLHCTSLVGSTHSLSAMRPIRAFGPLRPSNLSPSILGRNRLRPFSSSTSQLDQEEQKEAQLHREKMNTDSNEGTKTGTDSSSAHQDKAAYDPNITQPQKAKEKAGEGNKHNPLDASGANPELGRPTEEEASGAGTKIGSGSRK